MENLDLTRANLKSRALLEKISELTTKYENVIADLRVEITLVSSTLTQTQEELSALKEELERYGEVPETQEDTESST